MRWTFETMGTVVSVSTPGGLPDAEIRGSVEAVFLEDELEFSRYRPGSPISRIARGELSMLDASENLRSAYAIAVEWRSRTAGAFTPHRPDGVVDLDGVVKALAIQRAGSVLTGAGIADWCLGCGGDVLMCGVAAANSPWTIGVADPDLPGGLIAEVPMVGRDRAIATSGTAERGEHVWRSDDRSALRQVTVVADDIVTADVLATAILSGGLASLNDLARTHEVEVLALTQDKMLVTPRLRRLISAAAAAAAAH